MLELLAWDFEPNRKRRVHFLPTGLFHWSGGVEVSGLPSWHREQVGSGLLHNLQGRLLEQDRIRVLPNLRGRVLEPRRRCLVQHLPTRDEDLRARWTLRDLSCRNEERRHGTRVHAVCTRAVQPRGRPGLRHLPAGYLQRPGLAPRGPACDFVSALSAWDMERRGAGSMHPLRDWNVQQLRRRRL